MQEDLRLIGSLDDEEDVLDLVTNEFEEEPIKKDEVCADRHCALMLVLF